MFYKTIEALPCARLYEDFVKNRAVSDARIETFGGVEGYDVYNPSVPFHFGGKEYLAGRVERRDSEVSTARFFERGGEGWVPAEGTQVLPLQDPFVTFFGDELILGGVSVKFCEDGSARWHTDFYRGTPFRLEKFASGPAQMKDIRLLRLQSGKIAFVSRPQGQAMRKYKCIAKVGFTLLDSADELTPEAIERAPYLEKLFCDNEWGGVNQLIELKNGKIGVIGHKACRTRPKRPGSIWPRHYYGVAFVLDPATGELTQEKMIISSDCFPPCEPKRPDLADVTFAAGIVRNGDGTARVWTGLGDAHVGSALIPDPFEEYER